MSTMPIQAEIRDTWGKSVMMTVSHKNDRYTGEYEYGTFMSESKGR